MNENDTPQLNPTQQNNGQIVPPQPFQNQATTSPSMGEDTSQHVFPQTTPAVSSRPLPEPNRGAFQRRIGRLGYLMGHVYLLLFGMAIFIAVFAVMPALSLADDGPLRIIISIPLFLLALIFAVISLLAQISLIVRRLHDLGRPWPWILVGFIPLVSIIFSLYLLFKRGQEGSNEWGDPDPSLNFMTVLGLK